LKGEEMTKTPGEFEPPKPISKAERDACKTFRKLDAEKATTEHEIEQKAFSASCGQESQDQEEGALKIHPLSGRLGAFFLARAPAPAVLIASTPLIAFTSLLCESHPRIDTAICAGAGR
jgi:hypothetical protein